MVLIVPYPPASLHLNAGTRVNSSLTLLYDVTTDWDVVVVSAGMSASSMTVALVSSRVSLSALADSSTSAASTASVTSGSAVSSEVCSATLSVIDAKTLPIGMVDGNK